MEGEGDDGEEREVLLLAVLPTIPGAPWMSKVWRKKIVINDKIFVVPIVVGVGVTTKVFYHTLKMFVYKVYVLSL